MLWDHREGMCGWSATLGGFLELSHVISREQFMGFLVLPDKTLASYFNLFLINSLPLACSTVSYPLIGLFNSILKVWASSICFYFLKKTPFSIITFRNIMQTPIFFISIEKLSIVCTSAHFFLKLSHPLYPATSSFPLLLCYHSLTLFSTSHPCSMLPF